MGRVSDWNEKCGKSPAEGEDRRAIMLKQLDLIKEEVNEIHDAIMAEDDDNLLKELCDLKVVSDGLVFIADMDKSFDLAFEEVMDNNDLKWYDTFDEALDVAAGYTIKTNQPHSVFISEVDDEEYFSVHRDSDDKIMKAVPQPKVDLTKYLDGSYKNDDDIENSFESPFIKEVPDAPTKLVEEKSNSIAPVGVQIAIGFSIVAGASALLMLLRAIIGG